MTWQNGRKLISLKTNDNSITYKYDSNGLRTQKDDKNCTTCYYYDSKNNLIGIHYQSAPVLYFYYDSNGNVTSFSFNNTISTIYNLANLNPFKYRSYVYDNKSGLYYLQSRYYDLFFTKHISQYIIKKASLLLCHENADYDFLKSF